MSILGTRVVRTEDPRLLTGRGADVGYVAGAFSTSEQETSSSSKFLTILSPSPPLKR